jgi:predicted ABC-type transport system involved in lysophospholipase L1 biosynthesis ATPase subunit
MDYSEEAYQILLKMRSNGKQHYNQERYAKSLTALGLARRNFHNARQDCEEKGTRVSMEHAKKMSSDLEHAKAATTRLREIMEGKIKDLKMTDTMYEIMGYEIKQESEEVFNEWTARVCPEGYWMPGMSRC